MTDLAVTSKLAPHKNNQVGPILAKKLHFNRSGDQFWLLYTVVLGNIRSRII